MDDSPDTGSRDVALDYIKSSDFHMVWADGAIGGATPNGLLHFALYAERPAIPQRQVFALTGDGQLGTEILEARVSRNSVVREMSVDVLMSPMAAEQLGRWLIEHAAALAAKGRQPEEEG